MLNLNLREVARADVRVRGEIASTCELTEAGGVEVSEPIRVDLTARAVGEGVLIQGALRGRLKLPCRRCLAPVVWELDDDVILWFEPLEPEEAADSEGEVYPLPAQATELDLRAAVCEQLLLRIPEYVLCRQDCLGLCPHCGADRNETVCACTEAPSPGPWDALRSIKFD